MKKIKIKFSKNLNRILLPILSLVLFFPIRLAFAQAEPRYVYTLFGIFTIDPNGRSAEFSKYINTLLMFFYGLAGACAVMIVIFAGFQYMTARENAKQVQAAKDRIQFALIGLFIILGSWVIIAVLNKNMLSWAF